MGSPSETLAGNLLALGLALGRAVRLPNDPSASASFTLGPPAAASITDEQGHPLQFHSTRNPGAEADRALDAAIGSSAPPFVIIVGAGLGFLPEAIERRLPETRVLVIEPEPVFVRGMLSRRDWRPALASGKLLILIGPDYSGSSIAWRRLVGPEPPPVIEHPVLQRVRPAAIEESRTLVRRILYDARANADARKALEGPYLLNTLENLPVIAREADAAALDSAFTHTPAVLVAAGPSLDRHLEDLRAIQDRALIVSVDTAAWPLLGSGVQPHLVVAVDPSINNARHLESLPRDCGAWMVGEASLHPSGFGPFEGRTFCFRVAEHEPWPLLRAAGLDAGLLRAWGSVLTTAFDLTLRMGCDPIIFVGADLAYTEARPYCRGAIYEMDWAQATLRGHGLPEVWQLWLGDRAAGCETGVDGREVATAPRLIAFRDWIVDTASSQPGRRYINANGSGILRGGPFEARPLREAVGAAAPRVPRTTVGRIWRSSADPGRRVRAATQLVERVRSGKQPEVEDRWRAICERSNLDLPATITAVAERLSTPPAQPAATGSTAPDRRLAEHMARLRCFARDEALPDWATCSEPEAPASASDHLTRAAQDLAAIALRVPGELSIAPRPLARAVLPIAGWPHWTLAEASDWLRVEGQLGFALASRRSTVPVRNPMDAFPEMARADGAVATAPQTRGELLTVAASLEWAMVASAADDRCHIQTAGACAALDDPTASGPLLNDVLTAVSAQLAGKSFGGQDTILCRVSLTPGDRREPMAAAARVGSQYLMRSLTGLIVEAPTEQAPPPASVTILSGEATWRLDVSSPLGTTTGGARFLGATRAVKPEFLGGLLPSCLLAAVLNEREAVLAGLHQAVSFAVDQDGRVRPLSIWPRPVVGEVPWGVQGGALAWHNTADGPYIMLRRTADGPVDIHAVPFQPAWPLIEPDGGTFWSSYVGGLWSWHPERGSRLEADAPPCIGIRPSAGGIRLDPATKDDRLGTVRMEWHKGWCWERSTGVAAPFELGPEGLSWSISTHAGWTAEAHPQADLVRIGSPDGREFLLACYFPFSVAWAGGSLVVTSTTSGCVLLFPHLTDALQR